MKSNLIIFISILVSSLIALSIYDHLSSFNLEEEGKIYHIKAKFPHSSNKYIERSLKDLITSEISNFKKDLSNSPKPKNWKNELYISYEKSKFSRNIESYLLSVYTFTGGAHGSTNIVSKNFDGLSMKELELPDVFEEETNYLDTISQICINDLKEKLIKKDITEDSRQLLEDWIREGAAPKQENFRVFTFTPKEIIFHFGQYQVASYADGIQRVKIPFTKINNLLKHPFQKSDKGKKIKESAPISKIAEKNCIWDKFESKKLNIEFPIQTCSWGDMSPEFYEVGDTIFQMPIKFKNPKKYGTPIIKVFYKDLDKSIEDEIRESFINKLPKHQKRHCLVSESQFILNDQNKQNFVIEPDEFLEWQASSSTNPIDPCGAFGISGSGSIRYFEYHPSESKTKYIFVTIGKDTPLFNQELIKLSD